MNVRTLFEEELRQRGLTFEVDSESGRHAVQVGSCSLLVSLENLQRDFARDRDKIRIIRFVDAIVASASAAHDTYSVDQLYWAWEPNDYEKLAEFRISVSDRVDRVLVHASVDCQLVSWVTLGMLQELGLSEAQASAHAFANLARALNEATLETKDIDGVRLGYIETALPFKSSLILAPNLQEIVGTELGWPLLAVVPDRDFLYLWAAKHADFVERVGRVVVREYSQASYPISTEVYEITDAEIRAIGAFPSET